MTLIAVYRITQHHTEVRIALDAENQELRQEMNLLVIENSRLVTELSKLVGNEAGPIVPQKAKPKIRRPRFR